MKRCFANIIPAVLAVLLLSSCGAKAPKKAMLPSVSGKAGEVIVVINKGDWDSELGGIIRENLARDCEFLPQKEPLYTLADVVPTAFTNIFKIHRNLLICNVDSKVTEPGVHYKNDVWAEPQCVIQLNAPDSEVACQLMRENIGTIETYIEQAERNRVINNAIRYEEAGLRPAVTEQFGGSPVFPMGYRMKKKVDGFMWIAYETTYTNQGVFVYSYPAKGDSSDFSVESLVEHRDSVLKENVPGMFDNTYMITSSFATPSVKYLKYKGRDFTEMKGYWEVYNDFMGGPFVSHAFYSKDGTEVIVTESFVYAARFDKRNYLRQVESLLYSFKWKDDKNN